MRSLALAALIWGAAALLRGADDASQGILTAASASGGAVTLDMAAAGASSLVASTAGASSLLAAGDVHCSQRDSKQLRALASYRAHCEMVAYYTQLRDGLVRYIVAHPLKWPSKTELFTRLLWLVPKAITELKEVLSGGEAAAATASTALAVVEAGAPAVAAAAVAAPAGSFDLLGGVGDAAEAFESAKDAKEDSEELHEAAVASSLSNKLLNSLLVLRYMQVRAAVLTVADTPALLGAPAAPPALAAALALLPASAAQIRAAAAAIAMAEPQVKRKLARFFLKRAIDDPLEVATLGLKRIADVASHMADLPEMAEVVVDGLVASPKTSAAFKLIYWFQVQVEALKGALKPAYDAHLERCGIEFRAPAPDVDVLAEAAKPALGWYDWAWSFVQAPVAIQRATVAPAEPAAEPAAGEQSPPPPPPPECAPLTRLAAVLDSVSDDNRLLFRVAYERAQESRYAKRFALKALFVMAREMPDYSAAPVLPPPPPQAFKKGGKRKGRGGGRR